MANWCTNQFLYIDNGENHEGYEKFKKDALELSEEMLSRASSSERTLPLANLFTKAGYTEKELEAREFYGVLSGEMLEARKMTVTSKEGRDKLEGILVTTMTKWIPNDTEMKVLGKEKYGLSGDFLVFESESEDEELLINTDDDNIFFDERYVIDHCSEQEENIDRFATKKEAKEFISKNVEFPFYGKFGPSGFINSRLSQTIKWDLTKEYARTLGEKESDVRFEVSVYKTRHQWETTKMRNGWD